MKQFTAMFMVISLLLVGLVMLSSTAAIAVL